MNRWTDRWTDRTVMAKMH